MKKSFWVKKILKGIVIGALAVSVFSYVVMLLWNNVLAAVTGVLPVNFWQAMGILVLSKILFGGFRGGGGGFRGRGPWNPEMREKWQNMSEEDRKNFKQEWRNRCKTWSRGRFEQKPPEEG